MQIKFYLKSYLFNYSFFYLNKKSNESSDLKYLKVIKDHENEIQQLKSDLKDTRKLITQKDTEIERMTRERDQTDAELNFKCSDLEVIFKSMF